MNFFPYSCSISRSDSAARLLITLDIRPRQGDLQLAVMSCNELRGQMSQNTTGIEFWPAEERWCGVVVVFSHQARMQSTAQKVLSPYSSETQLPPGKKGTSLIFNDFPYPPSHPTPFGPPPHPPRSPSARPVCQFPSVASGRKPATKTHHNSPARHHHP